MGKGGIMYKVMFVDNTIFNGGNPENSLWNNMPNKPIKKIEYTLLGHTVTFEGYESYNHLKEKAQFLLQNNEIRLSKVILMAKKGNVVYSFIFDYFTKEILTTTSEFGKEYYGKETSGWKTGLQNTETTYSVVKNNSSD